MDAAFMSFQLRRSGIHAVRRGAGGAGVTEVPFTALPEGNQHQFPPTLSKG
jgi:hypothetical protein